MDAGFFRVSRSAGIWGDLKALLGRLGRRPKLGAGWPARGGIEHSGNPGCQRTLPPALRRRPVRPCAVSSFGIVPPTRPRRSPENGGGNGPEPYVAARLSGGACGLSHAHRRVQGPSGAARRKSLGGGRRETLRCLAVGGSWRV